MSDFVRQPLLEYLNRQNPITRIENLESATGARPSASVSQVSQLSPDAGDFVAGTYYAYDANTGQLRGYLTATPKPEAPGYHLAFFDSNGVFQFGVNADNGAAIAGGGAVELDENGITLPDAGDAIEISDSVNKSHAHLYNQDGVFSILNYIVSSETNLITNGDFETGTFSSWTETDPSNKLSVIANPDGVGYVAQFDDADYSNEHIQQNVSATNGCVVTLRARSDGGGAISVSGNGGETRTVTVYDDWRNYILVFNNPTTYLNFGMQTIGNGHIDNIVARNKRSANYVSSVQFTTGENLLTSGVVWINGDGTSVGTNSDFIVSGVADVSLLYADVSTDRVGIGTNAPAYKLDVNGDVNVASGSNFKINGVNISGVDGWTPNGNTWTFKNRTQAYTNDPAAGLSIVLNMTNTADFVVGSDVTVSSSAGSENTKVTAVVANTSITVLQLTLNHTTSSPLVTLLDAFTINADVTSFIEKGTKLKFTQTTVKYGTVFSATHSGGTTTIVMVHNSDYTLTNAAMSATYWSNIEKPHGWPDWFNFPGVATGSGSMTWGATGTAKYKTKGGKEMMLALNLSGTTGGIASNSLQFSIPVPPTVTVAFFAAGATADGAGTVLGFTFATTAPLIAQRKADSSNYGLGASRTMQTVITMEW